jgi:hypothetical protein
MLTYAALALSLCIASPCLAADECTYDQVNQIRVLKGIADRHPGGIVEEGERRITWPLKSGGTITYVYGGCVHLGSIVTRQEPLPIPHTDKQLFAVAMELASTYWDEADAAALNAGLKDVRYKKEQTDGKVYYNVRHDDYFEFYVEHEYKDGVDRIAIAWGRNF